MFCWKLFVESVLNHICILKKWEKTGKSEVLKTWSWCQTRSNMHKVFFFSETNIQKLIIQNWKFNIGIDIQINPTIMGSRIVLHLGICNFHNQLFQSEWYHHGQHIVWFPLWERLRIESHSLTCCNI